jgi:hypothetical protein
VRPPLFVSMRDYVILTNRKRAVIALIHSIVFCLIALRSAMVTSDSLGVINSVRTHASVAGPAALASIFAIVTGILVWLFVISRYTKESLYFGLCAVSAGTGFIRSLVGAPAFHSSSYIRVLLLLCAVAVGTSIWRDHTKPLFSPD